MTRRSLLASTALWAFDKRWTLIAHRGAPLPGVAENSSTAIQAAFARGYGMVEIDIRESRDGSIFVQHDKDFSRVFGVARQISEMDSPDICRLRSIEGGQAPLRLEEVCELVKGRGAIWIDTKQTNAGPDFCRKVERALRHADLFATSIIGLHPEATPYFLGRATTAQSIHDLFGRKAAEVQPERVVLCEGIGFALADATVEWARKEGFAVIPFVGDWHYGQVHARPRNLAFSDLRRLQQAGVTTFMIDSGFEAAFRR